MFARSRQLLTRIGYVAGKAIPGRPRIVLATVAGATISGNLAWISAGLRRELPGVEVVELARRRGTGFRDLVGAMLHVLRAGYHLASARMFLVDDYYFPMYVVPQPPGHRWVQVWHACGAFKKFGYSVLDKAFGADEAYVQRIPIHSTYDVCLVSAEQFIPAYMEAFGLPRDRFTSAIGIPRTDLFFDGPLVERTMAAVREKYGIPDGRRVVLYAPTFRGVRPTVARDPSGLDLEELLARVGADHVVLMRSHPFVRGDGAAPRPDGVIDVSDHHDINELMLVSDVLVTDYSSAIYEYALLGRPIAFLAADHEEYEHERGFYFDYMTGVPGPVFTTTSELAAWLVAGTFDVDRVRAFAAASFDVADGGATSRFIREIVRPMFTPAELQSSDRR
jgi:CDP-glycerol glycerophosphotransferase (TagB/SpsB family)